MPTNNRFKIVPRISSCSSRQISDNRYEVPLIQNRFSLRRSLYASAIKLAIHKVQTAPSVLLSKIHPILVAFGPVYPTLSRKCRIAWPRRSLILVPLYADRRLSFSFLSMKVNVYWVGIAINQEYAINGKLGCQNETERKERRVVPKLCRCLQRDPNISSGDSRNSGVFSLGGNRTRDLTSYTSTAPHYIFRW